MKKKNYIARIEAKDEKWGLKRNFLVSANSIYVDAENLEVENAPYNLEDGAYEIGSGYNNKYKELFIVKNGVRIEATKEDVEALFDAPKVEEVEAEEVPALEEMTTEEMVEATNEEAEAIAKRFLEKYKGNGADEGAGVFKSIIYQKLWKQKKNGAIEKWVRAFCAEYYRIGIEMNMEDFGDTREKALSDYAEDELEEWLEYFLKRG